MDQLFYFVILIFSVILHEVAHGYMANWLGDPTARIQGRLTLNPIAHIDLWGSILLPGLLIFSHIMPIGYAKPVPYNPYNLRGKYGEGLVAFAGPATNILLALVFGLLIRFGQTFIDSNLLAAFGAICLINISLALINLIPIPPIDGSKILSDVLLVISPALERGYRALREPLERVGIFGGIFALFLLIYIFNKEYVALLLWIFTLLTGATI